MEDCRCSRDGEFKRLNKKMDDIESTAKVDAKERNAEMMKLLESKIRTELTLEGIKKTQEEANASYIALIALVQTIKDKPFHVWKKLNWIWKTAIIAAVASQTVGTVAGYIKMLGK